MTSEALSQHTGLWRIELAPNYRQVIAAGIISAILAYVLIIYPLGYYGQFVAADAVGPAPVQEASPSLLNRIFFPLAALLSVTMYLLERGRAGRISLIALSPLALFLGYSGLSSFWALDPSTSLSKFLVLALVMSAVIPAAAVVDSAERYLKPMFWIVVATLLINLFFVLFTAPTAIGAAGIYSHKNSLGGVTALCTIVMLYGLGRPGRLYTLVVLVMVPVAFFILFRSQAKTALALTLLAPALGIVFTLARRYLRLSLPVLLGILAIVVPFVLMSGITDFSMTDISVAITGDPTFTGRTDLWTFAVEKIGERPWFGYGYHSFWQIGDNAPAWSAGPGFVQRTPHAHEGYLDLLLQGGFVGLGLFGIMYITLASWISRAIDEAPFAGLMFASFFAFVTMVNLLETTWFDPLDSSTAIFVALLATAIVRRPVRPETLLVREV